MRMTKDYWEPSAWKQRPKQAEKHTLEDNEMMQNQVQSLISERDERTQSTLQQEQNSIKTK